LRYGGYRRAIGKHSRIGSRTTRARGTSGRKRKTRAALCGSPTREATTSVEKWRLGSIPETNAMDAIPAY
jgi:hypothetical protein